MPLLKTEAPRLKDVDNWIKSEPINVEEGTYLLYFWNYSCSCCRDRLKLFERLHKEYSNISVVGIHTPKLDFERDDKNLEKAVEKLEIEHSIAHDKEGTVFEEYNMAYSDQAVIVKEGTIVYQQNTNRDREELEEKIADILQTEKKEIRQNSNQDREAIYQTFLGYSRTEGINQTGNSPGENKYQLPKNRKKNVVYLGGKWEQTEHYIEARENPEFRFKFSSSKLDIVIGPADGLRDVKVLVNGVAVSEEEAGDDLRVEDGQSFLRVTHPGLYNVIDSSRQEIEVTLIPDRKTRLYTLTFNQPEV
jgi:thiol-disulfide isomerase/thioredoxin